MTDTPTPTTFTVTSLCGQPFAVGDFYLDGIERIMPVTRCCSAMVKYMDTGIVGADEVLTCKGCYRPLDPDVEGNLDVLPGAVSLPEGWETVVDALHCADPTSCAREVFWDVERFRP